MVIQVDAVITRGARAICRQLRGRSAIVGTIGCGPRLRVQPLVSAPRIAGFSQELRPPSLSLHARYFSSGSLVEQVVKDFGAESITEGTLMEWKVGVGAEVAEGDLIALIETDKVSIEIKALTSGTIAEILVEADGTVEKNQVIAKIKPGAAPQAKAASSPSAKTAAPAAAPSAPSAPAPAPATPGRILEQAIKDFGAESITEGTLMEWRKNVGDFADKGELLAVIETDKVSIEVKAEEAGVVKEILAPADSTVEVGQVLVKIEVGGTAPAGGAAPTAATVAPTASPEVPAEASQHGAPLTGLREAFARLASQRAGKPWPEAAPAASAAPARKEEPKQAAKPAAPTPAAAAPPGSARAEHRVPMSVVRQRVVQRLKSAQETAALLTTFQEADMTMALRMRSKYKDLFKKTHNTALGLLSVFVKASSCALREVPGINAIIDDAAKEIVYRDYVDISVPIPSPRGPVTCVLRDVESMSILDIEQHLVGLTEKARMDEIGVDEMVGATFGINDSGVAGGMLGTGIINPPQSAVLGTNSVKARATVVDGKVVARPIMYLALTYDHRLIDGREAVTFLCSVRDKMEDPSRMLLDL